MKVYISLGSALSTSLGTSVDRFSNSYIGFFRQEFISTRYNVFALRSSDSFPESKSTCRWLLFCYWFCLIFSSNKIKIPLKAFITWFCRSSSTLILSLRLIQEWTESTTWYCLTLSSKCQRKILQIRSTITALFQFKKPIKKSLNFL